MRIQIRIFTLMRIHVRILLLIKVMRICDYWSTLRTLHGSVKRVHGPPGLHGSILSHLDHVFHSNADPDPDLDSQNNAEPDSQPCTLSPLITTLFLPHLILSHTFGDDVSIYSFPRYFLRGIMWYTVSACSPCPSCLRPTCRPSRSGYRSTETCPTRRHAGRYRTLHCPKNKSSWNKKRINIYPWI